MKSGGRLDKNRSLGRVAALPSQKARKAGTAAAHIKRGKLISWAAFSITILFIAFNLFGAPHRIRGDEGDDPFSMGLRKVDGHLGDDAQDADAKGVTDQYRRSRVGEKLFQWQDKFGLEIDILGSRPRNPGASGEESSHKLKLKEREKKYFLSAVVFCRIWKDDLSNFTLFEARQWLEYMKYSGVEHVFWYDGAQSAAESQERGLKAYVQSGFVTYNHLSRHFANSDDSADSQFQRDKAVVHCLNNYGTSTWWLMSLDADEYVFSQADKSPGFLDRFLRDYESKFPQVSQLLMQSMLFKGRPERAAAATLLTERLQMRKQQTEGVSLRATAMMKPIVRPHRCERVLAGNPYYFEMKHGKTVALPAGALRVNHYWGQGELHATPDGKRPVVEELDTLEKDDSIQPISDEIRKLLHIA